ncbi:MAG: methyltransferase [Bacteroidales bacterium]
MSNNYFRFKQFIVYQERSAFNVGTDGVLLGAYAYISGSARILEIGTGTGLIALMLAQRSETEIVAIEPEVNSYAEACHNTGLSKWKDRIRVINCTLQDYLPVDTLFDLIVANPPYFIDSLKNPDPHKSMARHNTMLSHADILVAATRLLREDGKLQIILPYAEGNIFIADAHEYGFYCNDILKIKPLPSGAIRRMILCFSRQRTIVTEKFLTIEKGKRHEFTDDYIKLTGDFYLNFFH